MRKKTPIGARLITQVVITWNIVQINTTSKKGGQQQSTIMASAREVKKFRRGLPLSPSLARAIPRMIAKNTKPKMFDPFDHSPEKVQIILENCCWDQPLKAQVLGSIGSLKGFPVSFWSSGG